MSGKRSIRELDPDYEDVSEQQTKRRKVIEEDAKEATKRKIESIIKKHFDIEINNKETELLDISEKLEVARNMMDRLRACIVANFFGNASQQKTVSRKSSEQTPVIHPTVRKFIGKAPAGMSNTTVKSEIPTTANSKQVLESEKIGNMITEVVSTARQQASEVASADREMSGSRPGRFKVKKRIIVGNLSKSIPADQRDDNDQATHKWMVYVRGAKDSPNISGFVKKVWFFLHPSYRPNDLVEVSQPPFHLTRRGWGEFPVRVQIHFKDSRNKRVDIIHNLKLDRTYTGLQTLGAETVVDIEIERDVTEVKQDKKQKSDTSRPTTVSLPLQIKQEPLDISDHTQENSQIPCQTFPLLKGIKVEPVDHDYGRTACLSTLSTLNSQQTVKKETESQLGNGHSFSNLSGRSQILLTGIQTIGSPSVITTQAASVLTSISQTHNHMSAISSSPAKQQIVSNSGNVLLTSPPGNIVLKAVGPVSSMGSNSTTLNLKLVDSGAVKSGTGSVNLTLTQPVLQTGLQVNKLQTASQNRIPLNQSSNSGLVFLKCTDNQGKTFLIPQQINNNNTLTSPTKGANPISGLRPAATNNRPILLTTGLPVSNITNLAVSGHVNSVQGKPLVQTLVRSPNLTTTPNRPQKSPLQNGPVFFIKPENVNRTPLTVKTSNISSTVTSTTPVKVNSNLQSIRNCSQKQSAEVLCVKPVNQSMTSSENQSINKGQLKVTPQGLIHVQGQTINPGIGISSVGGEKSPQTSLRPKQPIVLIPSNGKVTLLPGKGKSLLNSVTNIQSTSASGNNIILFNQSVSPVGSGNVVCVTPSSVTNQNKPVTKLNKSDMFVLQTKQSKPCVSTPNHVVIIPVSSEQSQTVGSSNGSKSLTSVVMTTTHNKMNKDSANAVTTAISTVDKKVTDKTMFIVVQNDKTTVAASLNDSPKGTAKSTASLLTSQSLLNSHNASRIPLTSSQLTQVTVSSSDARSKQILLVNQGRESRENLVRTAGYNNIEDKKCIMDPKKKKQKLVTVQDFIKPLSVTDYPDLLSLIRATVVRHPLVSENAGRSLHPYCAYANEDWLSWNVGKRRASEWQRASSVRKFILHTLQGSTTYKGKSLWTTKQILVWCRLHAYSPHYLEKPLHPTGTDLQAATSLMSDKHHKKFSSLTGVKQIYEELTMTERSSVAVDGEDDIDILSDSPTKPTVKAQDKSNDNTDVGDPEYLPLTDGALYVEDMAQQIGVRLQQTEVEPGYFGTLTHGMLYKSMENFMSDILRETFALQVNMGRYPDTLSVGDVYAGLKNLSMADFLTNKYLGVEENMGLPTAPT